MRCLSSALSLALVFAAAGSAFADDSHPFEQGLALQKQQQFGAALASFRRAYAMQPSPTSALHVAQCEVGLGHFVNAEADLRALSNAKIPDGSPPEYFAARDQAKAELASASSHVAHVRVAVTPPDVTGVQVTIDGVAVDASRDAVPVDPGHHVVVASAPGRAPQQLALDVEDGAKVQAAIVLPALASAPQEGDDLARRYSDAANWSPGDPVPLGFHADTHPRWVLVATGATIFGLMYTFAALVGANSQDKTYFVPVVGPFIAAANTRGSDFSSVVVLADALLGLAEVTGVVLLVAGLVAQKTDMVKDRVSLRLAPATMGVAGHGLALTGHF